MSSSTSNSSLARTRSLRSNSLKPSSSLNPQSAPGPAAAGPSNITLFLANLRLLNLDLRDDWPDITALTFSTRDAQQNQKKRIQCVEWALYQLFALWDPEETRNKLQPFFPPLEPLQSLNLRAALFRHLDQVKKNGALGRDTVLRKTMLDECKGERLEEVLAVFSNAVLKRKLQEAGSHRHEAIAQQLAFENFSYSGERTVLSALTLAHKASLSKHLRERDVSRARYRDFYDLLNLNHRRIARRHEQLKQVIEEHRSEDKLSEREVGALQQQVQKNWSGSDEWLETILYGDSRLSKDGLLATKFDGVWKHVENGTIGDVEGKKNIGLLEQLNARVRDQENRLARWQDFGRTLSKVGSGSPLKQKDSEPRQRGIELGFNQHEALQMGGSSPSKSVVKLSATSLDEYRRLIENMKAELRDVGKQNQRSSHIRPARQSLLPMTAPTSSAISQSSPNSDPATVQDEEWSSASGSDESSPGFNNHAKKSTFEASPSERHVTGHRSKETPSDVPSKTQMRTASPDINSKTNKEAVLKIERGSAMARKGRAPSPEPLFVTPTPITAPKANPPLDLESDLLADQILNSVSEASPSPKKPRHTLSLAERTRLSMSRASHSQYSDLHDDLDDLADLPRLSIRPKPSQPSKKSSSESEDDKHANLIERTRKSMAGFEAAQKKAHLERRQSVKEAKKRQRESSYFPRLEEEAVTPSIDTKELIEGDPDYESVFKSRPKIKTSPAVSPTRIWEDETED